MQNPKQMSSKRKRRFPVISVWLSSNFALSHLPQLPHRGSGLATSNFWRGWHLLFLDALSAVGKQAPLAFGRCRSWRNFLSCLFRTRRFASTSNGGEVQQ